MAPSISQFRSETGTYGSSVVLTNSAPYGKQNPMSTTETGTPTLSGERADLLDTLGKHVSSCATPPRI